MDQEEVDDLFEESAPINESGQLPSTEEIAEATEDEAELDEPTEEEPPEVETVEEEETDDQQEQPAPPKPTRTRPDEELEDESAYDKMDQEEIDDLFEESAPINESSQLPSTEEIAEATEDEAEPDEPTEEEPPEVETVEEEETDDQQEQPAPPEPTRTRPVRSNRFTGKYNMAMFEHVHNIRTQAAPKEEYDPEIAPVMAMIIMWFRDLISKKGHSHA